MKLVTHKYKILLSYEVGGSKVCSVFEIRSPFETSPTPYRRLRPGECPRECPRKSECPRECPGECLAGPSAPGPRVSKRSPESVPGVSKRCPDTPETLSGHSGARGPKGPRDTPPNTLSDTQISGDTLSDTPRDTSGPKGPKPPVGGWGCLKSPCTATVRELSPILGVKFPNPCSNNLLWSKSDKH